MLIANYQIPFPMPCDIHAVNFFGPFINRGHMAQLRAWFRTFLPELLFHELPPFSLHMQVDIALDGLFTHRSHCTIILLTFYALGVTERLFALALRLC